MEKFDSPGGIFVVHVSKGFEARGEHMERMLRSFGVDFEYMLRGDLDEITPDIKSRYFTPDAEMTPGAFSCSLKHIFICEEIVRRGLPGALVLEDDITLHRNFPAVFARSMAELKDWQTEARKTGRGVIVNYEDTRLRFVERSRREKGRVLYKGDRDRMTGCFYMDRAAAQTLLDCMEKEGGMCEPIDLYHKHLLRQGKLFYLWCQPTVATQGSHSGMFRSGVASDVPRFKAVLWRLQRVYKKLLYELR